VTNGQHITPQQIEEGAKPFGEIREAVGMQVEIAVELHSRWHLHARSALPRQMLDRDAIGIVVFDTGWVGGISERHAIGRMAETYRRPFAPHDCTGPVTYVGRVRLSARGTGLGTRLQPEFLRRPDVTVRTTESPSSVAAPVPGEARDIVGATAPR